MFPSLSNSNIGGLDSRRHVDAHDSQALCKSRKQPSNSLILLKHEEVEPLPESALSTRRSHLRLQSGIEEGIEKFLLRDASVAVLVKAARNQEAPYRVGLPGAAAKQNEKHAGHVFERTT